MHYFKRIASSEAAKFALTATLVVAFGCVCWILSQRILWEVETVYAPGFSETKFRRIREGMPLGDVLQILGPPLRVVEFEYSEQVQYDIEGETVECNFKYSGEFVSAEGPERLVKMVRGKSISEVWEILERLADRKRLARCRSFSYSLPAKGGSRSFDRRDVFLDDKDVVVGILRELWLN